MPDDGWKQVVDRIKGGGQNFHRRAQTNIYGNRNNPIDWSYDSQRSPSPQPFQRGGINPNVKTGDFATDAGNEFAALGAGYLSNLSRTGGFNAKDIGNIRTRATAPISSLYSNINRSLGTNRARQGSAANEGALASRMARDQAAAIGDTALSAELGIADAVRQGRLAGTQALMDYDLAAEQARLRAHELELSPYLAQLYNKQDRSIWDYLPGLLSGLGSAIGTVRGGGGGSSTVPVTINLPGATAGPGQTESTVTFPDPGSEGETIDPNSLLGGDRNNVPAPRTRFTPDTSNNRQPDSLINRVRNINNNAPNPLILRDPPPNPNLPPNTGSPPPVTDPIPLPTPLTPEPNPSNRIYTNPWGRRYTLSPDGRVNMLEDGTGSMLPYQRRRAT